MDQAENWKEKARFASIGITDQTRHLVLVSLLIVFHQIEKIVTEDGHLALIETVIKDLSEVFGLGERLWIVWTKCPRRNFANQIVRDGSIHKFSSLDGPARITIDLDKVIVHGQRLE